MPEVVPITSECGSVNTYAFRVSRPYEQLAVTIANMRNVTGCLVVYQHDADEEVKRDHIHGYMENLSVSTDTLKNWIKKELNVKSFPKTDWSFVTELKGKPVTRDFITYMSKGHLDPCMVYNVDTDEIITYRQKWEHHESKTKKKVQWKTIKDETPEQKKKRQDELMAECKKRLREIGKTDTVTIIDVIHQVVVVDNNTILGRYKFRDYVDYLRSQLRPSEFKQDIWKLCAFKD